MSRRYASATWRLRIKGQLVQAQLSAGIWRGLEQRAAKEGRSVEEIISEYLAPLVPERPGQRGV